MLVVAITFCLAASEGIFSKPIPPYAQGVHRQFSIEASLQLGTQIFRNAGDDQLLYNAFLLEPRFAFRVIRPIAIELGLGIAPTATVSPPSAPAGVTVVNPHLDVSIDLAHGGDGIFSFPAPLLKSRIRFLPYAGGGIGFMAFSSAIRPITHFSANLQAGIKVGIWRDLGVRAEFRGVFYRGVNPAAFGPGIFGNLIFTLGVYYQFGGKPPPDPEEAASRPVAAPPPCPEPAVAKAPPPVAVIERDSDNDGVFDKEDACPLVIGLATNRGCPPPDQDNDGIPDSEDQCQVEAGTPERKGCPEKPIVQEERERLVIRERAKFELDSAKIDADYLHALDAVAAFVMQHPDIELIGVHGHSDNQARPAYNMDISQKRAAAVVDYLVSKGVQRERLQAKGFGDTKPIAPHGSARGRAENRRVEFVILKRSESSTWPASAPTP
ncbi:MAG: OmpA family protein [Deltaproteobacteria bacterium]|nr:OmpA family protein [Deltaproteobacteria bacterium]